MMVEIVAEVDDRSYDFDNQEQYHQELSKVKEKAIGRLERGESLLSVVLGVILLGANLARIELFQSAIFGVSVALLIEFWLLAIAVSIIYRTSVLEVLAYTGDNEFNSLEEADAALGYQKVVSLVGFIQGLAFLLVFVASISKVKYDTLRTVLKAKYTGEPWLSLAWEQLNK